LIKSSHIVHEVDEEHIAHSFFGKVIHKFNQGFEALLEKYDQFLAPALLRPGLTVVGMMAVFFVSLAIFPLLGVSFFPRTDPGQFMINIKAPSGTRLEQTENYIAQVESEIKEVVPPKELGMIVSNIGVTPGFASIYTSNSGSHTATVQVNLKENHKTGSYEYMDRVRNKLQRDLPQLSTYFQTGGLVDAVLNLGLPAPIDIQIRSSHLEQSHEMATELANRIRGVKGVSDVMVPQDVDYPSLRLNIDRERASKLGLSQKEVVDNLITALTSNQMIAPSYWVDPKSGNDYLLTVQYPEDEVKSLNDLSQIPLRSANAAAPTHLSAVADVERVLSPTEVDHYQLGRIIDIYVSPSGEDLGVVDKQINNILNRTKLPQGMHVDVRGMVAGMNSSFRSFSVGLILAVILVYLILVAQFQSFTDPFIILLAIPMGITGVLLILWITGTSVNVMSLMGVVMMVGIVVSNSILIVDFTRRLRADGMPMKQAVSEACKVRLRPVLMTSLATILGLIPMAMALGEGSESYAPLARAIIGGLTVSVALTVFIVPAAYLLIHGKEEDTSTDITIQTQGRELVAQ
jgi:multidrug efflux pump subunit AcrB